MHPVQLMRALLVAISVCGVCGSTSSPADLKKPVYIEGQESPDQSRINVELLKSLPPGEKPTFHTVMKRITDMVEAEQRHRMVLSDAKAATSTTTQTTPTRGSTARSASTFKSRKGSPQQMNSPMMEMLSMMNQARLSAEDLPQMAGHLLKGTHQTINKFVPFANQPGGLQGAILKALGSGPGQVGDGHFGIAGLLRKIFKSVELLRCELESIIYEEFGVARPTKMIDQSKSEYPTTESSPAAAETTPGETQSRSLKNKARQMELAVELNGEMADESSQAELSVQTGETPEVKFRAQRKMGSGEKRLLDLLQDINAFLSIIAAAITQLDFRQVFNPIAAANFLLGPN